MAAFLSFKLLKVLKFITDYFPGATEFQKYEIIPVWY